MRWPPALVEEQDMVVDTKSTDDRFDLREYLPLVAHAVAEKAAHVLDETVREGLACAGMLGLLEATVSFPSASEGSFGAHALRRIRQSVGEELAGANWSERSAARNAIVVGHVRRVLPHGLMATPSPAEAAACLRLRIGDVRALINDVAHSSISVDQVVLGAHVHGAAPATTSPSPRTAQRAGYYADVAATSAQRADVPSSVAADDAQVQLARHGA